MFCTNCGHQNPAGANFCSSCGATLTPGSDATISFVPDEATSEVAEFEVTVPAAELAGSGVLIVKRGPDMGAQFPLESEVTRVGRHPESTIFLDDITVSRRHAEFVRKGSQYVVRDVGSLNGTYVNRVRIEEATLSNGDEVQVGKFKLVFVAANAS